MEHKDLVGNTINVGDFVVYAALWGRSPVLKYGRIVDLKIRKGMYANDRAIPTIGVITVDRDWSDGDWHLQKNGQQITLAYLDRMMVIAEDRVPAKVRELLKGK